MFQVDVDISHFLARWTEALFVMLDANFRLKCKERSLSDPSLLDGLAYFVKEKPYKEYIAECGAQTEVFHP